MNNMDVSQPLINAHGGTRKPNLRLWIAISFGIVFLMLVSNIVLLTVLLKSASNNSNPSNSSPNNVLCSLSCARTCVGKDVSCFNRCYSPCISGASSNNPISSSIRRDAIHHVGVTVSNLSRSVDFYTQVLGGVLVPNAGGDSWLGDTVLNLLFQKELLDALEKNQTMQQEMIANLADNGTDTLAARYINFGALQVELLDYRARYPNSSSFLPYYNPSSSPSVVNNMHICFYIRDEVDLNQLVYNIETTANQMGFEEVRCNRVIKVQSEEERKALGAKLIYNSFEVADGAFKGWSLAYCKGPDGEQFEFAQALSASKVLFDEALGDYLSSKTTLE